MRSFITLLTTVVLLSSVAFAQDSVVVRKTLVPYRKGYLWGFSDDKKNIVIAPKFDEAKFFKEDNNLYYAEGKLNGKDIIILEDGTHMDDEFSGDGGEFIDLGMLIEWYQEAKDDPSLVSKGKNGFDLTEGVFRKAPVYDYASDFFDKEKKAILVLKETAKSGVADNKGNILIPFEYDRITCINRETLIFLARKDKKWIVLDKKNKRIGDQEFDEVWEPSYDRILVHQGPKYGFLDQNGKVIIPLKYTKAYRFGDIPADGRFAWVEVSGFGYYIDVNGQEFYEK